MIRLIALTLVALAACSSPAFESAEHPSLARGNIPRQTGPILAHMKLVTVTFAGYEHETEIDSFGAWLPTSSWWTTVGAEYGIAEGESLGHVTLQETPDADVTLAGIGGFLASHIQSGALPSSPDTGIEADTVYVVYYPTTTTVHIEAGDAGCAEAGGFHASYSDGSMFFVFAAIPSNCTAGTTSFGLSPLEFIEFDASHEILEAASDPYIIGTNDTAIAAGPLGWDLTDQTNPWVAVGGEIADACTGQVVREDSFTVTRVWSNAAASADADPCAPTSGPYDYVSPVTDEPISISAGTSAQVPIIGWSSEEVDAWKLRAATGAFVTSSFVPTATVQPTMYSNGTTGMLTITVPPGTPAGQQGVVFLLAEPVSTSVPPALASRRIWPVLVNTR